MVTYNSARFIPACLESLRQAGAELRTELIVVDNGSADDTLALVNEAWPGATIIQNDRNLGFAAANNIGARQSRGDYLLLLNADTVFLDDHLNEAFEHARRTGVAILGPRMVGADNRVQRTWALRNSVADYLKGIFSLALSSKRLSRAEPVQPEIPLDVEFLVGAALLIDRRAWNRHGPFDEQFFFTCEERDLCLRYVQAGERVVYYPGWTILHYGGGGAKVSEFHLRHWIVASLQFVKKHGTLIQLLLARVGLAALVTTHSLVSVARAIRRGERLTLHGLKEYCGAWLWVPAILFGRVSGK